MSAVNPASFSPNAINQPPTGIGPGAITSDAAFDNSYTMAYGTDPDPYGAVPPYQLPINTYNPNYPGIPGIHNSFAPMQMMQPMLPMGPMHNVQQQMQPAHQYQQMSSLSQLQPTQQLHHYQPAKPAETSQAADPMKPVKRSKQDERNDYNVLDYLAETMLGLELGTKSGKEQATTAATTQGQASQSTTSYHFKTPMRPTGNFQPPIQRPPPFAKSAGAQEGEKGQKSKIDWAGLGMMRR